MIEGKCPKCGASYFGWALQFPRNQSCSRCGAALKIYRNGKPAYDGYSPFTAEKYSLKLPDEVDGKKPDATNGVKNKKPSS